MAKGPFVQRAGWTDTLVLQEPLHVALMLLDEFRVREMAQVQKLGKGSQVFHRSDWNWSLGLELCINQKYFCCQFLCLTFQNIVVYVPLPQVLTGKEPLVIPLIWLSI